jgi:alpha-glucuronidase
MRLPLTTILVFLLPASLYAQPGYDAWLRYAALDSPAAGRSANLVPAAVTVLEDAAPILRARDEIVRGVRGMLNKELRQERGIPTGGAIILGTLTRLRQAAPQFALDGTMAADGYWLKTITIDGARYTVIAGEGDRAVLYGTFAWLRRIALGEPLANLDEKRSPSAPIRWVNQWDNIDGTIERGYGGRSLFWEAGRAREDLRRVSDYGRLLASLGINGISINNVNANRAFLSTDLLPHVTRVADVLRPWGVRIALAIDFASPSTLGKLPTYDPLDPAVVAWWKDKAAELYKAVPDLGGFVLKADSEGRVGPSTYGRTHADAANVVARALAPHGGVIFYRGFVYDHRMDWRNPKNDRARAAYDNFKSLDGAFDDNVIIQIKNGPIDFQVREPASPLFGALEKTNQAIELQITQEYFGQARHTVFLVPMWKETLDFDMRVSTTRAESGRLRTPVKALVSGAVFRRPTGGFVGVANVGLDGNWVGNHLSQANLYGFGRLAWDADLSGQRIAEEWTRLTFGNDPKVVDTVVRIQLDSWRTYENYTGPLGLQTLTDIVGNHYGVAVEASERNGWGQWHRAGDKGVGMDRTSRTGTGFVGQYPPDVSRVYESIATVPDDLLLFLHHVPYTHRLHSGKTVIQYIYDSHYDGAAAVEGYVRAWEALKGRVDDDRYEAIRTQLEYQAGQAVVWRDAVSRWFLRASGIPDARRRVGNYPGRLEAESATLEGYVVKAVTPWEAASADHAVECTAAACAATFKYTGGAGRRDILVRYFDVNTGAARYRLRVGNRIAGEWTAADRLPTRRIDGSSSARQIFRGIALKAGDEIRIEGVPDGGETAALDYIEIQDASR